MNEFKEKHILLGVTGGISCYKVVELANRLTKDEGALVDVIMTPEATKFITPLTFQALTRRKVYVEMWEPWLEEEYGHVAIGERAALAIIAPATANTIAKMANGLADDFLTNTLLATPCPLLIVPAMNCYMWANLATQENITTLARRGATIIQPDTGRLASGAIGPGRLVEIERIIETARRMLGKQGLLTGRHVVITAGGTHEPIDPVRYIGNRSSGKMGYALAVSALAHGARVTLISGPTHLSPPSQAEFVQIETAEEMAAAVTKAVEDADVLIMAAAVADYRPVTMAQQKIKKKGEEGLSLELVKNPDIIASVIKPGLIKVGFAAETEDLLHNARQKLQAKNLDLIVANEARSSIGSDESTITIISLDTPPETLPPLPKMASAERIIERIKEIFHSKRLAAE